jgi:hypothetical protein
MDVPLPYNQFRFISIAHSHPGSANLAGSSWRWGFRLFLDLGGRSHRCLWSMGLLTLLCGFWFLGWLMIFLALGS